MAVTDLESILIKKRHDCKQNIQKLINKWLPEEKVMTLDKNMDGLNILRKIGNQKRKFIHYRDRRPYLLAESIDYIPDIEGTNWVFFFSCIIYVLYLLGTLGTLKLTGYLRGTTLSVNQLIHIPGLGDFQMSQIDAPQDPNKTDGNKYVFIYQ